MPKGIPLLPSDEDVRQAIQAAYSWRGVMRELGYLTTNGRTAARIRQRAESLGYDTSHFRGQRTWSDPALQEALAANVTWAGVLRCLGMADGGGNVLAAIRARATQLGLDYAHLGNFQRTIRGQVPFTADPEVKWLRRAAPTLAAGWFARRGYDVSFPTEPCSYDLIVDAERTLHRIQVKTGAYRDPKSGAWACGITQNPKYRKTPYYDPAEVDFFFLIDGDCTYYVVPLEEVAGQRQVNLPGNLGHRRVVP